MSIRNLTFGGLCIAFLVAMAPVQAGVAEDEASITRLMKQQFDKPEAPLTVAPESCRLPVPAENAGG